jgi:hypothetical protein
VPPKPNYSFEKRQRELEKKKKKAEKAQRKAEGGAHADSVVEPDAVRGLAPETSEPGPLA